MQIYANDLLNMQRAYLICKYMQMALINMQMTYLICKLYVNDLINIQIT